jgi:hypothetical protein
MLNRREEIAYHMGTDTKECSTDRGRKMVSS